MDLNTITAADFKAQFRRDFPYLPTYDNGKLYNAGALVYYPPTELFYTCNANGTNGIPPTVSASWTVKDDDADNYIQDADITNAFAEAQINYNQSLFGTEAQIKLGYLYLTAHYLCVDIRNSRSGIAATGMFPMTSRTVGSVSESYGIPSAYTDSPIYAIYSQTGYGMKYLSLVLPQLVGNIGVVYGGTNP